MQIGARGSLDRARQAVAEFRRAEVDIQDLSSSVINQDLLVGDTLEEIQPDQAMLVLIIACADQRSAILG